MEYDFEYCNDTILKINNSLNEKSLVILCGVAGSGKSSLIKYMLNKHLFPFDEKDILYVSYFEKEKLFVKESFKAISDKLLIIDNFESSTNMFENFVRIKEFLKSNKVLLIQRNTCIDLNYDYDCEIIKMPLLNEKAVLKALQSKSYDFLKEYNLNANQILEIINGSILMLNLLIECFDSHYDEKIMKQFLYVLSQNDNKEVSQLLYVFALNFYLKENYDEAERLFFHIVNLNTNDKIILQSLRLICEIKKRENKYEEAIFVIKQSIEKCSNNFEIAKTYNILGDLYRKIHNYILSQESFEFALSFMSTNEKNSFEDYLILKNELLINLASVLTNQQKYGQAIQILNSALSFNKDNTDQNTYYQVVILNNLASIYAKMNENKQAKNYYIEALNKINNANIGIGAQEKLSFKGLSSIIKKNIEKAKNYN